MGIHLDRDTILKAEDLTTEEVDVPQWGGTVLVRGLNGRERDEFEAGMAEQRGKRLVPNLANIRAKLVAKCCVNEDGKRLFTDADADALGEKSGAAVDRIFDAASRLSGMSDEDIEEMAENFDGTHSGGSSSNSHATSAAAPSKNSSKR